MGNKKKRTVRMQTLVFSLLLLMALTYSAPAYAGSKDVKVTTSVVQIDGTTKYEYNKEYKVKKKAAKAEYRKTVKTLKENLAQSLQAANSKGERVEARRKFKEGLKAAQQKLNNTLKDLKESYKKQISQ